jgi:hypothetical protein
MRHPVALIAAALLLICCSLSAPPVLAQGPSLTDLLPGYPEGGSTVIVTNEGSRSLDEYAGIFSDPEEAAGLLADWGFQENAFWVYEDTQLGDSDAERPYLQVGVTQFDSPTGAAAALPYIVQNLRPAGAHREILLPSPIGDESRQFVAEVDGGLDLTLLVRSDSLLIGISTRLTAGDQFFDPVEIAEGIIDRQAAAPIPTPAGMTTFWADLGSLLDTLPPDLPACLRRTVDERLDVSTMSQRFPGVPDAPARLEALGWQTAVHREFRCDPLPDVGLSWLDMSVHLFRETAGAAQAASFFAHARTVGTQLVPVPVMNPINFHYGTAAIAGPSENGTEYTLYHSIGPLLIRVSAIAMDGAPQADVESVMTALLANASEGGYTTDAPYLTADPVTGEAVALFPDGRSVPVVRSSPTPQSTFVDQTECMSTPSQCSLHDGVADWTSPAYGCDWNYATTRTGCVPAEQGDYDCFDLRAMGLKDIRVIGDDWMLLDEDGDGFGCEFIATETAYCESLAETERTACLDDLDAYLEAQNAYEEEMNEEYREAGEDLEEHNEALDREPEADYCDENICR